MLKIKVNNTVMKLEQHKKMRQSKKGEKDVTAIVTILALFLGVNNCFDENIARCLTLKHVRLPACCGAILKNLITSRGFKNPCLSC